MAGSLLLQATDEGQQKSRHTPGHICPPLAQEHPAPSHKVWHLLKGHLQQFTPASLLLHVKIFKKHCQQQTGCKGV